MPLDDSCKLLRVIKPFVWARRLDKEDQVSKVYIHYFNLYLMLFAVISLSLQKNKLGYLGRGSLQ